MKKEMLINVLQPEECRIAIVEDGVLEELYVERTSHESYTGNIYKGKVVNLEPAIQAAFVDFSVGRNGFLHVSDVEPQYHHRHLDADPRRDRPERGPDRGPNRGRADDREPGDRPRERDRPDRSEKGRRDRSERRFGEGLLGDDAPAPPPLPPAPRLPGTSRVEPERFERDEFRRPRFEPTPPPPPPAPRAEEPPAARPFDRDLGWSRERESRPPVEPEAPRARSFHEPEPFDPDLPPSRTQRNRPAYPTPRPFDDAEVEAARSRLTAPLPAFEPEPLPEPPSAREPRRGGRGRGRSPRESESAFGAEPESVRTPAPDLLGEPDLAGPAAEFEPEPELEGRGGPPRRRGGRAAIRSRGGEREPERPRARTPLPPAAPPIPEPETERYRPAPPERARGFEPEPPPTRERETERERERERERARLHDRAGEPGYVPRRERSRSPEPAFGPEPEETEALDWVDLGAEAETDAEGDLETPGGPSGKADGPRRRRRRRGRRRDRTGPGAEVSADADLDDETDDDAPPPPASYRAPAAPPRTAVKPAPSRAPDDDDLDRAFDFGDEDAGHFIDEEGDEIEARVTSPEDDQIDPGLEEEIRREVEEIAELEREMGLRGTTEARPRRGDERDAAPGPGRGGPPRGRGLFKPPIQEIFRRGDEVLVQVIKESIGTKGPTLSTYISIPGRYLVLMPGLNRVGVSRKIADEGQRRKLREIMNDLNPPKGLGFIVRTAGLERTKRELARDLAYLLRLWKVILRRIKKSRTPSPIYQESDMITRTIRDIFSAEIDTIWIDEPQAFERAQEFLRVVMPKYVDRLKLYDERVPLFHKYGIEDEIAKIQRRRVEMPEGGSIVIDQTEALVAIDVNSGNFRVENDAERTAYEMNLRAAKEIARQLRLRDLGGVIVNDFIDMRDERHRRGVEKALRDAIKRDRARTKILRMSAFGLIEMTRQRIRPSLKRSVYEDCPHCAGAGVAKTVESMSIDVMRLLALASHREDIRRVNVSVSTPVATHLNNRKRRDIARLETEFNLTVHIRPEDGVPAEHLQIDCFDGNNSEVRLLPAPPSPSQQRRPHGH